MKKRQGRTQPQSDYAETNPYCEICGKDERGFIHVHHIDQNRRNDQEQNFFSLCLRHHVGDFGVHHFGVVIFCERNLLTEHPKWKAVYERRKSKLEYSEKIKEIHNAKESDT